MSKHIHSPFDRLARAVLSAGIPEKARLLVAVSGGADSIALLHVLRDLSTWRLAVAHVNHSLRGAESDQDECLVRSVGEQMELEMFVQRVDVLQHAEEDCMSIEAAARELRWRSLRQMLVDWNGDFIVTGHTLTDQAETVLMRLLRGSGILGLSGMNPVGRDILRPFLTVEREAVLEYLREEQISFRTDSSNANPDHLRNRIRAETVPRLSQVQPRLIEVLGRTGQLLAKDADFLLQESGEALKVMDLRSGGDEIGVSRGAWLALHPSLKGHTLRLLVERVSGSLSDIDESHIDLISRTIEQEKGDALLLDQLPRHLAVYVDETSFIIRRGNRHSLQKLAAGTLQMPGQLEFEEGIVTAVLYEREKIDLEKLMAVCSQWHALFDADRLGESLAIRSRRAGDAMRPLGSPGTRKLKEIMIDRRVPREAREAVPVVESQGSVIWIAGLAQDEGAAVTEETVRVAHLTFRPSERLVRMLKYDCFPPRK